MPSLGQSPMPGRHSPFMLKITARVHLLHTWTCDLCMLLFNKFLVVPSWVWPSPPSQRKKTHQLCRRQRSQLSHLPILGALGSCSLGLSVPSHLSGCCTGRSSWPGPVSLPSSSPAVCVSVTLSARHPWTHFVLRGLHSPQSPSYALADPRPSGLASL